MIGCASGCWLCCFAAWWLLVCSLGLLGFGVGVFGFLWRLWSVVLGCILACVVGLVIVWLLVGLIVITYC